MTNATFPLHLSSGKLLNSKFNKSGSRSLVIGRTHKLLLAYRGLLSVIHVERNVVEAFA